MTRGLRRGRDYSEPGARRRREAIPIPITGMVGLCLCVILNMASAVDVFGGVLDSTILLFS